MNDCRRETLAARLLSRTNAASTHRVARRQILEMLHGRATQRRQCRMGVDQIERAADLIANLITRGAPVDVDVPRQPGKIMLDEVHQQRPLEEMNVRNLKQRADAQRPAIAGEDRRRLAWILEKSQ